MASGLSDDEFHRMQLQLLELRTTNYELDGKCKKLERELHDSSNLVESLEKELGKANKAISKSKKAKEVELLILENESFQCKLASQEEEFRLQNQTLMAELSSLVSDNESLKKECEELKGSKGRVATLGCEELSQFEDKILRLQAQNAALQKNLAGAQEKYEKEISCLKQKLDRGSADEQATVDSEDSVDNKIEVSCHGNEDLSSATTADSAKNTKVEELTEKLHDLQLCLDTESEEKQLLKEQLKTSKEQLGTVEDELQKLNEKFKKKQESFLQLQSEKEGLFEESRKKSDELQRARERDQKYYQDQITKLQQELEKAKQVQDTLKASSEGHNQELLRKVSELQKQVDTAGIVSNHQLKEQSHRHQQEIGELNAKLLVLTQKNEDLTVQLQASQRANEEATSQLSAVQQEFANQSQGLQEACRTAEKRKALLDEMAIKYQKEYHDHREKVKAMEDRHQAEANQLQEQIAKLQVQVQELGRTQPLLEELQGKVRLLEDAKRWLERRLQEMEALLQQAQKDLADTTEQMKVKQESELQALREQHSAELTGVQQLQLQQAKDWEKKELAREGEISHLKSEISLLNQSIHDKAEDQKIGAKKDNLMIKDLKRQLRAERKKVEKLQEALKAVSPENKNRSMEELFRPADPGDLSQCDGSSVSSWSVGASGQGKDSVASGPHSPTAMNTSAYSCSSEPGEEHSELLQRLAKLQQDKWQLEERVSHLETSCACMAQELLNKTEIIKHHFISSTQTVGGRRHPPAGEDKLTLKKVMEMVKLGEHSDLQEMNRKLQLVLEETLTKNMHLQQDLESMSQEVVRLSKLSLHSRANSNTNSSHDGHRPSTDQASPSTENAHTSQTRTVNVASSSSSSPRSSVTNNVDVSAPEATENGAEGT